jgi:hypothetical protein
VGGASKQLMSLSRSNHRIVGHQLGSSFGQPSMGGTSQQLISVDIVVQ